MQMVYNEAEREFRREVTDFVAETLPKRLSDKAMAGIPFNKDDYVFWQKQLHARGWAAPHWPKEYGGCAWSPVHIHIFEEVTAGAGAPRIAPFGINMIGPVLIRFGSALHQARYLPPILSGEEWWCQGFSEPNAGSDLASLRTKAVTRGDSYVISGQKTWITSAQWADLMFCLVRTSDSEKPQSGISMVIVDMNAPGITLRPIRTLDGGVEINEIFLDEVEVPRENLIGEEGKGWTYAKYLLGNERTGIAGIGRAKYQLGRAKQLLAERIVSRHLTQTAARRHAERMAGLEADLAVLEATALRYASADAASPAQASLLKLRGTTIQQAVFECLIDLAGGDALIPGVNPAGSAIADTAMALHLNHRKLSIFGGSNEIQRSIIYKNELEA